MHVSPALLLGPVAGKVYSEKSDYIAASRRHLSLPISEARYRTVLAVVARYRNRPQPSYVLDAHNCVTFVHDIARARIAAG